VIEMLHVLGGNMHVVAVCQPSVPVVAAFRDGSGNDPFVPLSMTLMGGPIDTRRNPTAVNNLAAERGIEWFRNNVIQGAVPQSGVMRDVYPGFPPAVGLHHHEFRSPHRRPQGAVCKSGEGDGDLVDTHREFYDEYLAVNGSDRGVLSANRRRRVRQARAAKGEMTIAASRSIRRRSPAWRDDGRRREGRHLGLGQTEATQHCALQFPTSPRALRAKGRRSLRRVQRFAVPFGNRARISDFMLSSANTKPKLVAAAE